MKLADAFSMIVPAERGVGFRAYDGSTAGPQDSDVVLDVRTPRAVEYLAGSPNQIGLARAYVNGDLEIVGDAYTALSRLYPLPLDHLTWSDKIALARTFAPYAFKRPAPPALERRQRGRRHSKRRDADAIHHHYDVSNRFYSYVLGPSMAYTCAVYPTADASLETAQEEKFDLVCRKLGLQPGMRLLDVGCGWGGLVLHAVKNYGVNAIGVTLSQQQALWGQEAIDDAGLGSSAQIRFSDYRDVPESGFDAVSSIGLTEHIGRANYPSYFSFLYGKLRAEGRMLNHTITRPSDEWKSHFRNSFITRYVFPDGDESRRVRDPARGEPARALRPDPEGVVREPRGQLGRRGRRGRSAGRTGVAPVHGGVAAGLRHRPDPAAPDAGGQARARRLLRHAAAPGLRPRPDLRLTITPGG